jgi:hypothetical protein
MFSIRQLAFLATVGSVALATPACAAQTYPYRIDPYRDVQRIAFENGYREGAEDGRGDAGRRRDFSYGRHDDYRDADDGYRRGYGDLEYYQHSFRDGYRAGYTHAFNQVAAPYGRPYPPAAVYPVPPGASRYGSPASQVGYRDGVEVGRNDARGREPYNPRRSPQFRSGDHDYDRRHGPREEYQQQYRAAFERGYRDGYRQADRR